ncbi:hypothetical protein ACFSUS_25800 [Spirosoma soli]|uniref:Uncharacterized protein n=1 Tax=Spirosoma soli TaxID=1770529 RepID=A0ABW5MAN1_9BACT
MSAKNFYQTLFQTDQLFRLADESWTVVEELPTAQDVSSDAVETATDLLSDLDALAVATEITLDALIEDAEPVVETPVVILPQPQAAVVISSPEPLPQPVPRPLAPSILPPVQQSSRLPQLNHKVLLLADEELDPSNLLFLEKILKAVNLNIDGVDLLNLHGVRDINFAELLRGKYINHFITFGVPFERINLDIMMDRYAPVRFEGITFLMADSLPTIEADQNLKKRLWAALQRVFLQRYA